MLFDDINISIRMNSLFECILKGLFLFQVFISRAMAIIYNRRLFNAVVCFIFATCTELLCYYYFKSRLISSVFTIMIVFSAQFFFVASVVYGCKLILETIPPRIADRSINSPRYFELSL